MERDLSPWLEGYCSEFWNLEQWSGQMLHGRDILVLARLLDQPPEWTFESLGRELHLSKSAVHRSIVNLGESSLIDPVKRRIRPSSAEEFLIHGLRYVFPARLGEETRGVPTAWAVAPLSTAFAPTSALPPVWPHAFGRVRGAAVPPLDKVAPAVALEDEGMHMTLAILDALRMGDARARKIAGAMLEERLRHPALM